MVANLEFLLVEEEGELFEESIFVLVLEFGELGEGGFQLLNLFFSGGDAGFDLLCLLFEDGPGFYTE